jgi:NADPH-dependent F420 reductase
VTRPGVREVLGIVGGTGAQGRGLAARWAAAGHTVLLGSRQLEKAEAKAADVRAHVGEDADVRPATNLQSAEEAEIVIVSVPYDAQAELLPPLRDAVEDKIVINVVNPLVFDEHGPRSVRVEAGSAAEENQALWPEARVASAFHDVSSRRLWRIHEPLETHVLVCGDDREATHRVAHLAARIPGMFAVYCGPLRMSEYVENITPLILFVNRYYGIHAGLLIDGIERDPEAAHAHRAEPGSRAGRRPAEG